MHLFNTTDTPSWRVAAQKKKDETLPRIPYDWILDASTIKRFQNDILGAPKVLLSGEEFEITEFSSAVKLAEGLASGRLKAVTVAKSFMHRAAIATQLTNCATEIFFEYGIRRAQELDDYYEQNQKPIGPFHGLPISLKDSFNIKDVDSTLGYVCKIGNAKLLEQSTLTNMLIDLGAVLYIKSNIPQTLMTADSENNIFGRTLNPNNPHLTAGGLSGGEGAMVRQRGSIIGVGTDIAGSVRIPASCCGVYGFKPTSNRIPYDKQMEPAQPIYMGIEPSAGPLANDYKDLQFFVENIVRACPWQYDYTAKTIPFAPQSVDRKLTIGFILEDFSLPVHPPVLNNIKRAIDLLKDAGHKVVQIKKYPNFEDAWKLAIAQYSIEIKGEETGYDWLARSNEPLINSLKNANVEAHATSFETLQEVVPLFRQGACVAKKWHDIFCSQDLDVILSPVAPYTAPPHDTYGIAPYTSMWNVVDYPAISIPFGDAAPLDTPYNVPTHLKGFYAEYEPKAFEGGIGSIQIVAPTDMDEKLLAAGAIIDSILNSK